jgi:hypothetical protein
MSTDSRSELAPILPWMGPASALPRGRRAHDPRRARHRHGAAECRTLIAEGQVAWGRMQVTAAVRDCPEEAARVLRDDLRYRVIPTDETESAKYQAAHATLSLSQSCASATQSTLPGRPCLVTDDALQICAS